MEVYNMNDGAQIKINEVAYICASVCLFFCFRATPINFVLLANSLDGKYIRFYPVSISQCH